MRTLKIKKNVSDFAEGSVLIEMGRTRVLCTAMVEEKVPRFLMGQGTGWVTAEYNMLPSSTPQRHGRRARRGAGIDGRASEIQRLIGRSLRAGIDLDLLGERTIYIDCDVLQADGGTRTASINGGFAALSLACRKLVKTDTISVNPILTTISAISLGVCDNCIVVDLDYAHDSTAEVDMNIIMDSDRRLIEIQGTAERKPFSRTRLNAMLKAADTAINSIRKAQHKVIGNG